jgi:hypothetical protein
MTRSKVSEIIDKWNSQGKKEAYLSGSDGLRRSSGDVTRRKLFAPESSLRGAAANHHYYAFYGSSAADSYSRGDPYLFPPPRARVCVRACGSMLKMR